MGDSSVASTPAPTIRSDQSPVPGTIVVGCKVPIKKISDGETIYRRAEILAIRPSTVQGVEHDYYVHYSEFNKRLDEWVHGDQVDRSRIEMPAPKSINPKSTKNKKQKLMNGPRHDTPALDDTPVPAQKTRQDDGQMEVEDEGI